ncbi:MAG: hypothetical protein Q9159_003709 [Coniocarpon cinnabarinum]
MSGNRDSDQEHGEEHPDVSTYPTGGIGLGLERLPPNLGLPYSQFSTGYPQQLTGYPFSSSEYTSRDASVPTYLPEVIVFSPQSGDCGELVILSVRSAHDITETHGYSLSISFSGVVCPVSIQPMTSGTGLGTFQYAVSFRVPQLQNSGSNLPVLCPLELLVQSDQPHVNGSIPIGTFTLRGSTASQSSHSTSPTPGSVALSRASISTNTTMSNTTTSRRSSHQAPFEEMAAKVRRSSYAQPLLYQGIGSIPPTAFTQPPREPAYGPVQNVEPAEQSKRSSSVPSPRTLDEEENIHPAHKSSSYPLESERRPESGQGSTRSRRSPPLTPYSTGSSNPPLVRTSTLANASSSAAAAAAATGFSPPNSSHGFNPYAIYPSKAHLKIEGDLDRMAFSWSEAEISAKRRLVEFKRSQNGNTINTSFKPVTPEQRAPNSICVSCVWWEEKDECFVTSVDTIQLLESLVGVRFTVEEKNRIRRNLEGFRPLTVAKGKADSERFFKVIMDFPNPKPRNIEKDVKVFPWKILANALKKIIGKYSASYASTASSLHPTNALEGPSSYAIHEQARYAGSPLSQSSGSFSMGPGQATGTSTRSPYAPNDSSAFYGRQTPYTPSIHHTPGQTPQHPQYMSYGPIEYSWPQQDQSAAYEQTHQLHRGSWTPQYNFDGSPMSTTTPQFGPAQPPMSLPLQQRRSSAQPGYGHYITQGTQA